MTCRSVRISQLVSLRWNRLVDFKRGLKKQNTTVLDPKPDGVQLERANSQKITQNEIPHVTDMYTHQQFKL